MPDGTWRDAVVYSLVNTEWPAVKLHLEAVLARADPPALRSGRRG